MEIKLNRLFGPEGEPVAFGTVGVYESGPDGRHLVSVSADQDGHVPAINVTADVVRVEVRRQNQELLLRYDDLRAANIDDGQQQDDGR